MTTSLSSRPEPFPAKPQASGALYGALPLAVPRRTETAAKVTILSRDDDLTTYEPLDARFPRPIWARLDTKFEYLLQGDLHVHHAEVNGRHTYRMQIFGNRVLSRVVAEQSQCTNPDRYIVDHKNRVTTDDFLANLRWVTSALNKFNIDKKVPQSGFIGVIRKILHFRSKGTASTTLRRQQGATSCSAD